MRLVELPNIGAWAGGGEVHVGGRFEAARGDDLENGQRAVGRGRLGVKLLVQLEAEREARTRSGFDALDAGGALEVFEGKRVREIGLTENREALEFEFFRERKVNFQRPRSVDLSILAHYSGAEVSDERESLVRFDQTESFDRGIEIDLCGRFGLPVHGE